LARAALATAFARGFPSRACPGVNAGLSRAQAVELTSINKQLPDTPPGTEPTLVDTI